MATSVVHRITVFDAEEFSSKYDTLKAAAPDYGDNYSAAALKAQGGFCIGSRAAGDDADIDTESITPEMIHEGVTVRPAGALTNQRYITRHAGVDELTFTAYDVVQDVFELDSNVATTGQESQRTATQTNRALIVEIDGIRADVYPNVVLHIVEEEGGYGPGDDAVNKYGFRAKICSTPDIPSGQVKLHYEVAGT